MDSFLEQKCLEQKIQILKIERGKYFFKCSQGHIYIKSRHAVKYHGPFCAKCNSINFAKKYLIKRAKKLNLNINLEKSLKLYKKPKWQFVVVCPKGHEYITSTNQPRKTCPECVKKEQEIKYKNKSNFLGFKLLKSKDYWVNGNKRVKLFLECVQGHTFERDYGNLLQYFECPECKKIEKKVKKAKEVEQKVISEGFKLLTPYKGYSIPIKLECSKGHIFDVIFNFFNNNPTCPICKRKESFSKGQKEIFEFLKKELKIKDLEQENNLVIPPYELDIYSPSYKIAVEFNGLFWHSFEWLLKKRGSRIAKELHLIKSNLAKEKKIRLIQIFEDEWYLKKDIVKNLLKNAFKIKENSKWDARKSLIKKVSFNEAKEFLNKYHIHGAGLVGKIRLGLYYQKDLISLLTFNESSKSKNISKKKGEYELYKFCSRGNVRGALGKLFNYFKKEYSPKLVRTYIDKRFFTGNSFYKQGFELEKETPPNYYYFKPDVLERIHRFGLRKNWEGGLTEMEQRNLEGYLKIYDAGHLKLIWKREK